MKKNYSERSASFGGLLLKFVLASAAMAAGVLAGEAVFAADAAPAGLRAAEAETRHFASAGTAENRTEKSFFKTDLKDKEPRKNGLAAGPAFFTASAWKENDRSYEKASRLLSGNDAGISPETVPVESSNDRDSFRLGMEYSAGKAKISAAAGLTRIRDSGGKGTENNPADLKTFSLGLEYSLSDETSFHGTVTHIGYEKEAVSAALQHSPDRGGITGASVGISHKF